MYNKIIVWGCLVNRSHLGPLFSGVQSVYEKMSEVMKATHLGALEASLCPGRFKELGTSASKTFSFPVKNETPLVPMASARSLRLDLIRTRFLRTSVSTVRFIVAALVTLVTGLGEPQSAPVAALVRLVMGMGEAQWAED